MTNKIEQFLQNLFAVLFGAFILPLNHYYRRRNTVFLLSAKVEEENDTYYEVFYQDEAINFGIRFDDVRTPGYIGVYAIVGNKRAVPFKVERENFQIKLLTKNKEILKPVPADEPPEYKFYSLLDGELEEETKVYGILHFKKVLPLTKSRFSLKLGEKLFHVIFPKRQIEAKL